jgi:hypothetical protein
MFVGTIIWENPNSRVLSPRRHEGHEATPGFVSVVTTDLFNCTPVRVVSSVFTKSGGVLLTKNCLDDPECPFVTFVTFVPSW